MIALLRYSIGEASLSLARGWRSGLLAIAIIAAAVFIAGAVLLVSINVDRDPRAAGRDRRSSPST